MESQQSFHTFAAADEPSPSDVSVGSAVEGVEEGGGLEGVGSCAGGGAGVEAWGAEVAGAEGAGAVKEGGKEGRKVRYAVMAPCTVQHTPVAASLAPCCCA